MEKEKNKKIFKLSVLGLFKWESEEYSYKEVAFILGLVMAFIIGIILLLKLYALPTLGTPVLINKAGIVLNKIFKSRAP
jgi:hypothetical protein